jgi:hypothetical protein
VLRAGSAEGDGAGCTVTGIGWVLITESGTVDNGQLLFVGSGTVDNR